MMNKGCGKVLGYKNIQVGGNGDEYFRCGDGNRSDECFCNVCKEITEYSMMQRFRRLYEWLCD